MKKAIMSVLTVWILVSSMFIGLISFSEIENVQAPYTPHSPIRINSNTEFTSMAGLEGWAGNGLPGNPYIIEGYDINGSGYGYCIYIGNTTVIFEVRDSYLHEASGGDNPPYFADSGLTLYNVQNSIIANNTASSNEWDGIDLVISTNNIIANNNPSNNLRGIYLQYSSNNTIANNNASNSYGIDLQYSSNNTIANNNASNCWDGIRLRYGSNNIIANNTVSSNNGDGIDLQYSNNNTIDNNTASSNNGDGVFLQYSSNSTITKNNVSNNDNGIHLQYSSNNTITQNNASNNQYGIYLINSNNSTIIHNNASNNQGGITLSASRSNTLANNEMVDDGITIRGALEHWNTHIIDTTNTVNGKPVLYWKNQTGGFVPLGAGQVILANCSNVVVENHNIRNGTIGIALGFSNSNTITNNTLYSNNAFGIGLSSSSNNAITNNYLKSSGYGIGLSSSSNNTITHNNATNNYYGIYLFGSNMNTIADNNASSNSDYGIVIYVCSNNTVTHNNALNNLYGIWLGSSINNTIIYNNASYNDIGIDLYFSNKNNTITYNNASSNSYFGIRLFVSSNNTITNNHLTNNDEGIYLISSSKNNTIANNTVFSNYNCGINIYDSSSIDNSIYHNRIIQNANQTYDKTNNGNQWDNGYPSGGNYWSDYTSNDSFKGPNQDIPGSDGIGDTPYIIDADSQDNYPLISPFTNRTFDNYLTLKEGWNLLSLPFIQQNQSLKKVLEMIDGWYDAVQWFNSSDSSDPWKHNHISKPSHLNDLIDIDHKIGFWIHITNPGETIFLYNGTQPTSNQTIPLYPGWNMVGYPSLTNGNRTAALNNLTFGVEVDAIWTFDAATQTWEEIGGGDYFEVGRGYWIHARQECVWEVGV